MVTLLSTLKADNWSSGAISDYQTITPIGAGMSFLFRHFLLLEIREYLLNVMHTSYCERPVRLQTRLRYRKRKKIRISI